MREPAPVRVTPVPAPSSVPPCPGAAVCLAAGIAKALEELEDALSPEFSGKGGWIRGVRIAGRRLRILLRPLVEAGDPLRIQRLRRNLGTILDELSASRDLQVVRKWLAREDVSWEPEEQELGRRMLGEDEEPAGSGSDLQAGVREQLQDSLGKIRSILRHFLPEELHRPLPPDFPGVRIGDAAGDPLPRWKALRHADPSAGERAQVHDFCAHLLADPLERMERIHDDSLHPEDLHDIRRDLRKFRYLVEALTSTFPTLGSLREPMKHFVWLLGQVNDRRLIEDLLEARPRTPEETEGREAMESRLESEIEAILVESREMITGPLARGELAAVLGVVLGRA